MTTITPSPNVGGTLAGGIQDVSAILPLIGTEQCDKHVGSALTGGYLYAAATPLSIFGSLGIVKAGISILISSISIPVPHISLSFQASQPSFEFSVKRKWLGGRMLKDAGFELMGTAAPLIGMDGHRFKAETRLIEILEEKHIDNPDKISVEWKSQQWNVMLVISTILAAALSIMPYIALFLGPHSWRPTQVHLPWLYPVLRIVGSCSATVACQFIIQSRVISLMKNRILFKTIHQRLETIYQGRFNAWLKDSKLIWDASLPAEQCISSLEQHLSSFGSTGQPISIQISPLFQNNAPSPTQASSPELVAPLPAASEEIQSFNVSDLHQLQRDHFPFATRDAIFTVLLWIILGFSLPATVAGYIGCFTLIGATPLRGIGPLVWVGLEGALSILRIFIWASNPSFDENTEITLRLKLSDHQPLVTTHDYNPYITDRNHEKRKAFILVPEREFLERITPFTGPLDQFRKADNIALYFTWIADNHSSEDESQVEHSSNTKALCLLMTLFDIHMEIGVTLMPIGKSFHYFDAIVKYNPNSRKMEADIQSESMDVHPWTVKDSSLFDSLIDYYKFIVGSFSSRATAVTAKWDLSQKSGYTNPNIPQSPFPIFPTAQDQLYLDRGYEHQLKTNLIKAWGKWIIMDMAQIKSFTRADCFHAPKQEINLLLDDQFTKDIFANTKAGKWELTAVDKQLVWGWASRELVLPILSLELEGILQAKMDICACEISRIRQDAQLRTWINSEFEGGRRKRMEQEREAARKRMKEAMQDASEQADREGRPWLGHSSYIPPWTKAIEFIDKHWSIRINNLQEAFPKAEKELKQLISICEQVEIERWLPRSYFVEHVDRRISYKHWRIQHKLEEEMMDSTVERICTLPANSTRGEMDMAYEYPEPDEQATAKFVELKSSTSSGKACSALVYDTFGCNEQEVCDVIAKKTTRSVVNVDPRMVASIPPNDHLLFLSCSGNGEEPTFVQQNRDRWWEQQTRESWMFYFTPMSLHGEACSASGLTIAHILVFLIAPCTVYVSALHSIGGDDDDLWKPISVSIQEEGEELESMQCTPLDLRLSHFPPFVLQPGRHKLELIPHPPGIYYLRDIYVNFSEIQNQTPEYDVYVPPEFDFINRPKNDQQETITNGEGKSSLPLSIKQLVQRSSELQRPYFDHTEAN